MLTKDSLKSAVFTFKINNIKDVPHLYCKNFELNAVYATVNNIIYQILSQDVVVTISARQRSI